MVSSLSAIVALDRKCYLTSGDNSGAGPATAAGAIGITFAYLCLILKHGRYSSTAIGNFSTMFHIILKKLRSYLVVALFFSSASPLVSGWSNNTRKRKMMRALRAFSPALRPVSSCSLEVSTNTTMS